jgi:hypothetical protein
MAARNRNVVQRDLNAAIARQQTAEVGTNNNAKRVAGQNVQALERELHNINTAAAAAAAAAGGGGGAAAAAGGGAAAAGAGGVDLWGTAVDSANELNDIIGAVLRSIGAGAALPLNPNMAANVVSRAVVKASDDVKAAVGTSGMVFERAVQEKKENAERYAINVNTPGIPPPDNQITLDLYGIAQAAKDARGHLSTNLQTYYKQLQDMATKAIRSLVELARLVNTPASAAAADLDGKKAEVVAAFQLLVDLTNDAVASVSAGGGAAGAAAAGAAAAGAAAAAAGAAAAGAAAAGAAPAAAGAAAGAAAAGAAGGAAGGVGGGAAAAAGSSGSGSLGGGDPYVNAYGPAPATAQPRKINTLVQQIEARGGSIHAKLNAMTTKSEALIIEGNALVARLKALEQSILQSGAPLHADQLDQITSLVDRTFDGLNAKLSTVEGSTETELRKTIDKMSAALAAIEAAQTTAQGLGHGNAVRRAEAAAVAAERAARNAANQAARNAAIPAAFENLKREIGKRGSVNPDRYGRMMEYLKKIVINVESLTPADQERAKILKEALRQVIIFAVRTISPSLQNPPEFGGLSRTELDNLLVKPTALSVYSEVNLNNMDTRRKIVQFITGVRPVAAVAVAAQAGGKRRPRRMAKTVKSKGKGKNKTQKQKQKRKTQKRR